MDTLIVRARWTAEPDLGNEERGKPIPTMKRLDGTTSAAKSVDAIADAANV